MKPRHVLVALLSGALLSTVTTPATAAGRVPAWREGAVCSAAHFHGDARLGPAGLPASGRVGHELDGWRRTGHLTVKAFLARYYSPRGGWIRPPADGYYRWPGGSPIEWKQTLRPGRDIDRYGDEHGTVLMPVDVPYADRSLPPQSLDGPPAAGCGYHEYQVRRALTVESGPTAPWFGQLGHGLRFQVVPRLVPGAPRGADVRWLVARGYLRRLV